MRAVITLFMYHHWLITKKSNATIVDLHQEATRDDSLHGNACRADQPKQHFVLKHNTDDAYAWRQHYGV